MSHYNTQHMKPERIELYHTVYTNHWFVAFYAGNVYYFFGTVAACSFLISFNLCKHFCAFEKV